MISHLRGTVLIANNAYLVLEVGGVGYKVFTTPTLLQTPVNSELALFVYQKVSDSEISLFGLPDQESLEFFEKLISGSGVGPKIALGIISTGNLQTLRQAISNADSAFFGQVGGVGKKTAERIVVELKDKLAMLDANGESGEIFSILLGLGYSAIEIRKILPKINSTESTESQIKQALQLIGR